jgi:hypothetical protein
MALARRGAGSSLGSSSSPAGTILPTREALSSVSQAMPLALM